MTRRTLLRNGIVLTMDSAVRDSDRADVLIEGGAILTVGRDLAAAVLNARAINAAPLMHTYGAVLHMDTSNVETVFVDGRVVKAGGRLVDVHVPAVADELAESADGLLRRSGARSILLSCCRAS